MKNTRIVERTNVDGTIEYVIQQRHYLYRWCWIDVRLDSMFGERCKDTFSTLEKAKKNLCYFDGTKIKEKVLE